MENEKREENRKIVVYGVISFVVIIFILFLINDIFLTRELTRELNVRNQFCNGSGKTIQFNTNYGSNGNGHLEDGTPTYIAYFVDCK